MMKQELQLVDTDKAIRAESPKLYKWLPRFVLNYIKRIAHQDDLNEILTTYQDYRGLEFNAKVLSHLNITYSIEGVENFPPEGERCVFASNHPLGGLDGIVLIDAIGKQYGNAKFVVNDLLMYLKPLEDVFVPVNKHGQQSADYVKRIDDLYSSTDQVLFFPAGICSRRNKGIISDPEWKKSFIVKAAKYNRQVVPVYFDARNSNFFYNLSSIRRKLGIKANIEMFFLVNELFKKRNSHFRIIIGKPISVEEYTPLKPIEATNFIRQKVYKMEPNP